MPLESCVPQVVQDVGAMRWASKATAKSAAAASNASEALASNNNPECKCDILLVLTVLLFLPLMARAYGKCRHEVSVQIRTCGFSCGTQALRLQL